MKPEDEGLKSFMLTHFDFDSLKQVGFYPKGIRRDDYQGQADRICHRFSFKSVFEWITQPKHAVHVSYIQDRFKCPVCTCEQAITGDAPPWFEFKCLGFQRILIASMTWSGYNIYEKGGFNEKTATYYDKSIKFVEKF